MDKTVPSSYRLSRVYAQGWNTARKLLLSGEPDSNRAAALNPYAREPERTRWRDGFAEATGSTAV